MSLTLWHRQFRNPIFLVLWTCYSEVQLVTSAAVSLFGGATRCMNICVEAVVTRQLAVSGNALDQTANRAALTDPLKYFDSYEDVCL